ncbi:MAG TPA: galactose-1-phosphate uridylyltransferase [Candidatus Nitrosotalea sp.]|nr:galactose-1-phosphate uridylyltransferase [Candidatus Nitrosotalea sp.]
MGELRWHPLLEEWVTLAPERQDRDHHPEAARCPLCPTRPGERETEIPLPDYHIAVFENRFPAYAGEQGRCEVVCYTPEHDSSLGAQPVERIRDLIEVWSDRTRELSRLPGVRYVMVFENRGESIGVTLTHPHGQIYAYPFVPPVVERELAAQARYRRRWGACLYCQLLERELGGEHVLLADPHVAALVPAFARWPYEVHLAPLRHQGRLEDLSEAEVDSLAQTLKSVLMRYDRLFAGPMPYVMVVHQRPPGRGHSQHHLHLELYPAARDQERLKHLAGSELGAGAYILDVSPENAAARLRDLV